MFYKVASGARALFSVALFLFIFFPTLVAAECISNVENRPSELIELENIILSGDFGALEESAASNRFDMQHFIQILEEKVPSGFAGCELVYFETDSTGKTVQQITIYETNDRKLMFMSATASKSRNDFVVFKLLLTTRAEDITEMLF